MPCPILKASSKGVIEEVELTGLRNRTISRKQFGESDERSSCIKLQLIPNTYLHDPVIANTTCAASRRSWFSVIPLAVPFPVAVSFKRRVEEFVELT